LQNSVNAPAGTPLELGAVVCGAGETELVGVGGGALGAAGDACVDGAGATPVVVGDVAGTVVADDGVGAGVRAGAACAGAAVGLGAAAAVAGRATLGAAAAVPDGDALVASLLTSSRTVSAGEDSSGVERGTTSPTSGSPPHPTSPVAIAAVAKRTRGRMEIRT
jgi:hypothetical protein